MKGATQIHYYFTCFL